MIDNGTRRMNRVYEKVNYNSVHRDHRLFTHMVNATAGGRPCLACAGKTLTSSMHNSLVRKYCSVPSQLEALGLRHPPVTLQDLRHVIPRERYDLWRAHHGHDENG